MNNRETNTSLSSPQHRAPAIWRSLRASVLLRPAHLMAAALAACTDESGAPNAGPASAGEVNRSSLDTTSARGQMLAAEHAGKFSDILFVTANLRSACSVEGVDYRARFGRFVHWFASNQLAAPDIIALQELPAWAWCAYDHNALKDYEATNLLLAELAAAYPASKYRVAYALAANCGPNQCFAKDCPPFQDNLCHFRGGNGMIYNSVTIEHLSIGAPDFPFDEMHLPKAGVWRSLPCCSTRSGESCPPIDGPMNTEKCGVESPTGSVLALGPLDLSFSRFRVRSVGMYLHVYNTHNGSGLEGLQGAGRDFMAATERRFQSDALAAPVIALGDFNWVPSEVWPGDFNVLADRPGIDGIVVGQTPPHRVDGMFLACDGLPCGPAPREDEARCSTTNSQVPDAVEHLFSDHCGPDAQFATIRLFGTLMPCAASSDEPCEDGDGIEWEDDNCPRDFNPDQENSDAALPTADPAGDACDEDRDGDGIGNLTDNCPNAHNPEQANSDLLTTADEHGDACDTDDDGDCIVDTVDACPLIAGCSAATAKIACGQCKFLEVDWNSIGVLMQACRANIPEQCFNECCGIGPLGDLGRELLRTPAELLEPAGITLRPGAQVCMSRRPPAAIAGLSCDLALGGARTSVDASARRRFAECQRKREAAARTCGTCP